LRHVESDLLVLFEEFKTAHIYFGMVCEQLFSTKIWRDKTKAHVVVEPFNFAGFHVINSLI